MQLIKQILLATSLCLILAKSHAQQTFEYDDVNRVSDSLYQKQAWKSLLGYGKEAILHGQDFSLLRQRMGYAAFILGNYSEAISQYEAVLKSDSYNTNAHYFIYLSTKYLGQPELASKQIPYFSNTSFAKDTLKKLSVTNVGAEASYKTTNSNLRGNTGYYRADFGLRLGWNINMQQAVSQFNQTISLPSQTDSSSNVNLEVRQFGYYNKLTFNLGSHWQAKLAYNYLQTNFNGSDAFNDNLLLLGIKYHGHYFELQADATTGTIIRDNIRQLNLQLNLTPFGNLDFYSHSVFSLSEQSILMGQKETDFNFKEIIGGKISKNLWLEANTTFGGYRDLIENDGLYINNAIDKTTFKAGIIGYFTLSPKCLLHLGYGYEQRQISTNQLNFKQQSITGGITWKF